MAGRRIGVLALQGDFEAHARALAGAGAEPVEVRTAEDLADVEGLVIPGGESTTMLKLLNETGMKDRVYSFGLEKPIFGTCAGAILLAAEVTNPVQESLGLMDIAVERNGYGRQLDSRIVRIAAETGEMEAVFIRAPIIRRAGEKTRVLARYNGDPVLVEQGRHLVATFHPELSRENPVHKLFVEKVDRTR